MTVSPIAKLVVVILGAIAGIIVGGSVVTSLLNGFAIDEQIVALANTAVGFIGGVLAKTTIDAIDNRPQQVEVVNTARQAVPVTEESADPAPVEP